MAKINRQSFNLVAKTKSFIAGRKILTAILIIILIILGLGAWRFLGGKGQQPQYQTAKVEQGTIVSSVNASGKVLTANLVSITTSASGIVKAVNVKDGDIVSTSQKIAEITLDAQGQQKNAAAWSSYLSAKNNIDAANATAYTLRSTKDTAWKKFYDLATNSQYQNSDGSPREDQRNSSAEFQSAQADWLAAEAKYKNQQAVIDQIKVAANSAWLSYQLTSSTVSAPISGTIENVGLVEGMVLASQADSSTDSTSTSSQRVAVIQNEANPMITIDLTEIDVPKVKIGQKATVTLDSLADKTFTGEVVTIDRIGTTSNNVTSYPVIVQLDTTSNQILPNMAASANIILETKSDVLTIPSAAVQTQAGQSYVRVLRDGRQEQVSVEIGISSDTQTEIISGLSEGDEVTTGTTSTTSTQEQGRSIFGGGSFGGGTLRSR
jgi:macrolide-specific efflux system membrane fusion protein